MARISRLVKTIAEIIKDKKGEDILILDMRGLTITDYFIIVTANSTTHAGAIMEEIEKKLKLRGYQPIGIEGIPHNHWILMDYGDIVIHIFLEEFRELYDLERLWYDASQYTINEKGEIEEL